MCSFFLFYFIRGIVLTLFLFSIIDGSCALFSFFLIHSWVFMGSCALFSFLLNDKPSTRTLDPRTAYRRGSRSQTRSPPHVKSNRIASAALVQQESAHAAPTSPRACAPAPNREMQQKVGGERCNTNLLLKYPKTIVATYV
jgi:hypothetical protein